MNGMLLLIIGGAIITGGDILLKKWATNSGILFLLSGLSISLIGLLFLALGFKSKSLTIGNIIFVAVNMIVLVLAQVFYFKEALSYIQLLGIAISVIGVCIIEFAA